MRHRGMLSWISLTVIVLIGASALDYVVFMVRQRRGETFSFVNVRQYLPVSDAHGYYHYTYFGQMDIPCVSALLPHQHTKPCWWISMHSQHYEGTL